MHVICGTCLEGGWANFVRTSIILYLPKIDIRGMCQDCYFLCNVFSISCNCSFPCNVNVLSLSSHSQLLGVDSLFLNGADWRSLMEDCVDCIGSCLSCISCSCDCMQSDTLVTLFSCLIKNMLHLIMCFLVNKTIFFKNCA